MHLRRHADRWWALDPKTRKPLPARETANSVFARLLQEFPDHGFAGDARRILGPMGFTLR